MHSLKEKTAALLWNYFMMVFKKKDETRKVKIVEQLSHHGKLDNPKLTLSSSVTGHVTGHFVALTKKTR